MKRTPTEDASHRIQERDSQSLQNDLLLVKGLDSVPSSSKEPAFFESITFELETKEPLKKERIHGRPEFLSQPSHAFLDENDLFSLPMLQESIVSTRTEGVNEIENLPPLPTTPSNIQHLAPLNGQKQISESMNFSRLMDQADVQDPFF